jgi:peptidyl-prolyl cis-trans isomerase B (cyclophilin B)
MTYPPAQPAGKASTGLIVAAIVAVVIALGGIAAFLYWPPAQTSGTAVAAPSASTGRTATTRPPAGVSCRYSPTPDSPAAKNVGTPGNDRAPASGTVRVTLKTDQGDIPITLDRAKAPCAVQSFLFLTTKKYFDGTICHRLTAAAGLKVLQCGDPTGTGRGGPGYQFDDELPRGLKSAGADAVVYPAGTVAMANAGPDTNGSQFFLVYSDSTIPPNYPVIGAYTGSAQTTLDKIAAAGLNPAANSPSPDDGTPKVPVNIQQAAAEN